MLLARHGATASITVEAAARVRLPSGPQHRTQPAKLEIPFGHAFDRREVWQFMLYHGVWRHDEPRATPAIYVSAGGRGAARTSARHSCRGTRAEFSIDISSAPSQDCARMLGASRRRFRTRIDTTRAVPFAVGPFGQIPPESS